MTSEMVDLVVEVFWSRIISIEQQVIIDSCAKLSKEPVQISYRVWGRWIAPQRIPGKIFGHRTAPGQLVCAVEAAAADQIRNSLRIEFIGALPFTQQ